MLVVCSAGLCAGVAYSESACYFPPHPPSSSSVNPPPDSSRTCHFCQPLGHHYCSFRILLPQYKTLQGCSCNLRIRTPV